MYHSVHQRDGLYTWYPDHWENGNAALVDALLAGADAQLRPGATVQAVEQRSDTVAISYLQGGVLHRVSARCAVIATTADAADALLQSSGVPARRLFDATRYGSYIVVALAGASALLPRFRSLVPLDGELALVMQQRAPAGAGTALLCYYASARFHALGALDDAGLLALTRQELQRLGIDGQALLALDDVAVRRWERAATILSPAYRACSGADMQTLGDRLFIAGDYVATRHGIGYGMADAVASGFEAARRVRAVTG
jgi:protoporphyrinogen oxidase